MAIIILEFENVHPNFVIKIKDRKNILSHKRVINNPKISNAETPLRFTKRSNCPTYRVKAMSVVVPTLEEILGKLRDTIQDGDRQVRQ